MLEADIQKTQVPAPHTTQHPHHTAMQLTMRINTALEACSFPLHTVSHTPYVEQSRHSKPGQFSLTLMNSLTLRYFKSLDPPTPPQDLSFTQQRTAERLSSYGKLLTLASG